MLMQRILILIIVLIAQPLAAHDHSRPDLNDWFLSLQSEGGSPCCDGPDATRIEDADWDSKDGHYRVRLEGEWVDVPASAVVKGANRAGPTLVWPWRTDGKLNRVRCFLPGSMT